MELLAVTDRPEPARVRTLLQRYVPVRLNVEDRQLANGDRLAVVRLIEAAKWIDPIYWRQRSEIGWQLKQELSRSSEEHRSELDRLLTVNFGPWDSLNGDRPFWGTAELAPGGNFYPSDLTRAELNQYLETHPEEKPALLNTKTLVRRRGDRLIAIPYEQEYGRELEQVAAALVGASETATHERFRRFLQARAKGLRDGNLYESEKLWVLAADSPIDVAIGPYEVYDDALRGVKTSYEAIVLARHQLSTLVDDIRKVAPKLGGVLPGAVAEAATDRRVEVGVYDLLYAAGIANMGSKAIAKTLPNDERVRNEVGTRMLLFRNVIEAKFDSILKPIAKRLISAGQLDLVQRDAFLFQTLLHESGHALSHGFVECNGQQTTVTVKDALAERYSTIEECRADLIGAFLLTRLVQHGALPAKIRRSAVPTFIAHAVRTVRFGVKSDHARAAAIILSHLCRSHAIHSDGRSLSVDSERAETTIYELAIEVQSIANEGDYDAAGRLIEQSSSIPPKIAGLLNRIEDLPIDLEFVFDESARWT